jgi:DNA-binding NtrC family response regulator
MLRQVNAAVAGSRKVFLPLRMPMDRSMRSALDGCRVLILEDEYFLADDLKKELISRGAKVVGPIPDLLAAQDQVSRDNFDVAVIDVKLRDEFAWSIADMLVQEKIPFVFATGYGPTTIPERFRAIQIWEKPYDISKLMESIRLLCADTKANH